MIEKIIIGIVILILIFIILKNKKSSYTGKSKLNSFMDACCLHKSR